MPPDNRPEPLALQTDRVQQTGEPLLGIPSGCLSYPAQRARRAFRTLCSARGRLFRVPLGHGPSLSGLRQWLAVTMWLNTFVRPLHRYYSRVRLPGRVHVESAASGLLRPDRPRDTRSIASGISRFPCKKLVYMPWFSDSAGPLRHSRLRGAPCSLPAIRNRVGNPMAIDFGAL